MADLVVSLILAALVAFALYRIKVGLHYKWEWKAVPQFLLRYDEQKKAWVSNILLQGLYNTIRLSIWGTVLATIFGTITGLFRISQRLFYRLVGRTYVELIRNIPPLVLIFIFYYFLSGPVMTALGVDAFVESGLPVLKRS